MFGVIRRTYNNFFITICTSQGKVLISKSVGSFHDKSLRAKQRRNLIGVELLCQEFSKIMRVRKLLKLETMFIDSVFKRNSPKRLVKLVLSAFRLNKISIKSFLAYKTKAHNGVMLPKRRR